MYVKLILKSRNRKCQLGEKFDTVDELAPKVRSLAEAVKMLKKHMIIKHVTSCFISIVNEFQNCNPFVTIVYNVNKSLNQKIVIASRHKKY
jgi:hypothetical protein